MNRQRLVAIACTAVAAVLITAAPARAQSGQINVYDNPTLDTTTVNGFVSDPQGAIRAARELIAAGDMDGAIRRLELYVQIHPGEIDPRRFLGDLYFRTGQIERAKFVYEEILKFAPSDKETHNRLGTVYAEENRVDDAIAQFNAALPGTDSVNDLVALHIRKGDLDKYEIAIQQMARDYPTDSGIQGELGQVYYAIHQPAQAEVYYDRALDEDSTNLTALNGLGLAQLELHQYDDAVKTFEHCLAVDHYAYQCENNEGATYLEAQRYGQAKATLDAAFKLAPERAETFVNYGYLADAQDDWQRAVAQYAKAIELYPYLREAYIDLALDYEHHQLYVLAQAVLIKGIASVHDDGRLHVLLGDAYEAQGDRSDALEQFKLGEKGTDPTAVGIASQRVALLTAAATSSPHR
ncbi:MAG TPA: tetratricopeptide repeat protein [Candidatus Acidoferrales bacterium]|nr:tetratricopeptide repeat protein [Candidatus Acidoferrales bacterium]